MRRTMGGAGSLLNNVNGLISNPHDAIRSALIRVCAEWRAYWKTKRFIEVNATDLQSIELTLGMVLRSTKVAVCEPLVMQAIALLRRGYDLSSEIRERFRAEEDASVKGTLLELVVAQQLNNPNLFVSDVQRQSTFEGVVSDAHLDDERVKLADFGTDNASNVIFMPAQTCLRRRSSFRASTRSARRSTLVKPTKQFTRHIRCYSTARIEKLTTQIRISVSTTRSMVRFYRVTTTSSLLLRRGLESCECVSNGLKPTTTRRLSQL